MDAETALRIVHGKERKALRALIRIYGDDTNAILNALHGMSARIAIATQVSPEDYMAGIKLHWDFLANALNESGILQAKN